MTLECNRCGREPIPVVHGVPLCSEDVEAERENWLHFARSVPGTYKWWCTACYDYMEPRPEPWPPAPIDVEDFQLCLVYEGRAYGLKEPDGISLTGPYADHHARSVAHRRVREALMSARPAFDAMQTLLGEPVLRSTRDDGRTRIHAYALPLWPDLLYEVTGNERGFVTAERFIRAPHSPTPRLNDLTGLRPWRVLLHEVREAFPEPELSWHGYSRTRAICCGSARRTAGRTTWRCSSTGGSWRWSASIPRSSG